MRLEPWFYLGLTMYVPRNIAIVNPTTALVSDSRDGLQYVCTDFMKTEGCNAFPSLPTPSFEPGFASLHFTYDRELTGGFYK